MQDTNEVTFNVKKLIYLTRGNILFSFEDTVFFECKYLVLFNFLKHASNISYLFILQAFIFWVVDNFLKRKIKGTKTIYVTENDSSVTYHRRQEKAHSYNKIERSEESDLLASTDEEIDIRHRSSSTDHLLS